MPTEARRILGRSAASAVVAIVLSAAWLALPSAASAQLSWGPAVNLTGAGPLVAISCPGSTTCTAVDSEAAVAGGSSTEFTFKPASPATATSAVVDSGAAANALSCPSTSLCVETDTAGQAEIFNPTAPAAPATVALATYSVTDIACPLVTQCTSVVTHGRGYGDSEETFDPTDPSAAPSTAPIAQGGAGTTVIACPSQTQCTTNTGGQFITFDPQSSSPPSSTSSGEFIVNAIACPTTSQCTAVNDESQAITFDPTNIGSPTPVSFNGNRLTAIACPSATDCVALDASGDAYEGNPQLATAWASQKPDITPFAGIACPTNSQCVAADGEGNVFVGTAASGAGKTGGSGSTGSVGRVRVSGIRASSTGAALTITCGGAPCEVNLVLAAGLRKGAAATRQVRLSAGATKTIRLTLRPAANRLLRKDHVLRGVLTITEQTATGEKTVARRKLTIRGAARPRRRH